MEEGSYWDIAFNWGVSMDCVEPSIGGAISNKNALEELAFPFLSLLRVLHSAKFSAACSWPVATPMNTEEKFARHARQPRPASSQPTERL